MRKIIATFFLILSLLPLSACGKNPTTLYDISVFFDGDRTLNCSMTVDGIEEGDLYFNLYGNAYRKNAVYSPLPADIKENMQEEDYGYMEINSVTSNDKPVFFDVGGSDKNLLRVKRGNKSKITINYTLYLPLCNHRLGRGEKTVNVCNFYPILCSTMRGEKYFTNYYLCGDPFFSDVANYKVTFSLPSTYSVASSMDCDKTEVEGERSTYSYSRNKVRDIAFILSENFKVCALNQEGVDIKYYYYFDEDAESSLQVGAKALKFYGEKFGKYPYSSYVFCQANFAYGGMEYPCLTYISDEVEGEEKNYCIAHETAHQWWYGLVGVNEVEYGCIDEGLTEFSTALFMSNGISDKSLQNYVDEAKQGYLLTKKAMEERKIIFNESMDRNLNDYYFEEEYVALAYCKGMLAFNEVYNELGAKEFFKRAKKLVKKYGYKNIGYLELEEAFGKNGGEIIEKYRLGRMEIE